MIRELITFAKKVRNILGLTLFLTLSFIVIVYHLFSKGSFDSLITSIGFLDNNQTFILIMTISSMIFFLALLLIVLSFIEVKDEGKIKSDFYRLFIIVHEKGNKAKIITGAKVTLLSPPKPIEAFSDEKGSAIIWYQSELEGKKYEMNVSMEGYFESKPINKKLKNNSQFFISMERILEINVPAEQLVIRRAKKANTTTFELYINGISEIQTADIYFGTSANGFGCDPTWQYKTSNEPDKFFIEFNLEENVPFKNFVHCLAEDRHKVKKLLNLSGYKTTGSGDESSTHGKWRVWFLMRKEDNLEVEGDGGWANNLVKNIKSLS